MFNEKRELMFNQYNRARNYFIQNPNQLIEVEHHIVNLVNHTIAYNLEEIKKDYNEASYLYPFWAEYQPVKRGRDPRGDQVPWIEVGEHAVGEKINRFISSQYRIAEVGLPSGADDRFVLYSDEISKITQGFTNCVFLFLDIKSVGPRDNFDHTVVSPYQVSGDGGMEQSKRRVKKLNYDGYRSKGTAYIPPGNISDICFIRWNNRTKRSSFC